VGHERNLILGFDLEKKTVYTSMSGVRTLLYNSKRLHFRLQLTGKTDW